MDKIIYCNTCGNVKVVIDNEIKQECVFCKSIMRKSSDDIDYFKGETNELMPLWEDVVRKKHIEEQFINDELWKQREESEQQSQNTVSKNYKVYMFIALLCSIFFIFFFMSYGYVILGVITSLCSFCLAIYFSTKIPPDIIEDKQPKCIPTIICPYCQSTDTVRITTRSKAINTVLFGILSTKRHSQWHCNSCLSDF